MHLIYFFVAVNLIHDNTWMKYISSKIVINDYKLSNEISEIFITINRTKLIS